MVYFLVGVVFESHNPYISPAKVPPVEDISAKAFYNPIILHD